ncbi:S8 family serine peptidase [Flavobacterium zepuense]|uniref:S8 family serine peptidase n=1 Tax=Flavobacterium zepuense TaxID=2593302 RepID=A0A552V3Q3_9FLAO|nr:S8 family serine peptidase [Flavobacterium zepuense]TRW25124.1 S8 family serine peptidase [Flavobacterium zepuense]
MKKNTVSMLVLGLLLAGGFSAKAQTEEERRIITKDYDQAALTKFINEQTEKTKKNRDEAYRLAALNGWPTKFVTEEGNHAELVGLQDDGKPLYYQTLNANAAFTSGITSLNTGGSLGLTVDGQGMLAAIWDQDRPRATHNTFSGTIGQRLSIQDAATVQATHSTHVFGTIIGNGNTGSNGNPNASAKGMAPLATGNAYDWNSDTVEMGLAASSGLLVSNHSYGAIAGQVSVGTFGAYTSQSQEYDNVAFLAKNYLIVQAAGNDRNDNGQVYNPTKGGYDLINNAKTAKNSLIVAAVVGLTSEYSEPSDVLMSSFSSYGPTDDKRVKPDIAAKGVSVISSIDDNNSSYGAESGTSMASPVVAGGALLLQQHYHNVNGAYMRSATLRGLICHTADEAGDWDGPDARFGWGLFDAKKAAQAITNNGTTSIIEERSLSQGASYSFDVTAIAGQQLQVSICWTDPAGNVSSSADSTVPRLKNDLDVEVTKGGTSYLPWKLATTNGSPSVKGDNDVDNIERIDIPNASGTYTITIDHEGSLTSGPQEYSLIVTNATEALGADDFKFNLFAVWPNPANSEVNINLVQDSSAPATVAFYDIQGREVLVRELSQSLSVINTNNLSAGVYMVKVTQGAKQQVKKVVVNK